VWAGLLPGEKTDVLEQLKAKYGEVAMVGDNLNDIPVLGVASFSIAMVPASSPLGAGSAHALVLPQPESPSSDLHRVAYIFALARETTKRIRQNITWAIMYNLVALTLSTGLLQRFAASLVLTPITGSVGMSLSSTFILLNSMRLKTWVPEITTKGS